MNDLPIEEDDDFFESYQDLLNFLNTLDEKQVQQSIIIVSPYKEFSTYYSLGKVVENDKTFYGSFIDQTALISKAYKSENTISYQQLKEVIVWLDKKELEQKIILKQPFNAAIRKSFANHLMTIFNGNSAGFYEFEDFDKEQIVLLSDWL